MMATVRVEVALVARTRQQAREEMRRRR